MFVFSRKLLMLFSASFLLLVSLLLMANLSGSQRLASADVRTPVTFNFFNVRTDSELRQRDRLPNEPTLNDIPDIPEFVQNKVAETVDVPVMDVMSVDLSGLDNGLSGLAISADMLALGAAAIPLSRVAPQYPLRAQQRGIEGAVTVEFEVDEQGFVTPGSVLVIKSNPIGVFDASVLHVITQWRFQAKKIEGQAVAFRARQTLSFDLGRR